MLLEFRFAYECIKCEAVEKIDTTFWLIMWLNNSLTYAVRNERRWGRVIYACSLSLTNSVMSDTSGIIGRTPTRVSYMLYCVLSKVIDKPFFIYSNNTANASIFLKNIDAFFVIFYTTNI